MASRLVKRIVRNPRLLKMMCDFSRSRSSSSLVLCAVELDGDAVIRPPEVGEDEPVSVIPGRLFPRIADAALI